MGDEPKIVHRIPHKLADRGTIVGAYMSVRLVNGGRVREWMSKSQIDGIRDRFAAKNSAAWNNPETYPEMARKTVFKRGAKKLPKANEYLRRAEEIEHAYDVARATGTPAKFTIPPEVLAELPREVSGPNTATERLKAQVGLADGVVEVHGEQPKEPEAPALEQAKTVPVETTPAKEAAPAKASSKKTAAKPKETPVADEKASPPKEETKPAAKPKQGWEDLAIGDQWKSPESGKTYVVIEASPNLFPGGKTIQELEEPPADEDEDDTREDFE
jgi:hypothetical protein